MSPSSNYSGLNLEGLSLHRPTGPLQNKNFLANQLSINVEPFQRTDIGMNPLGPTNYMGSNNEVSKSKAVNRVQSFTTKSKSPKVAIVEQLRLSVSIEEQES